MYNSLFSVGGKRKIEIKREKMKKKVKNIIKKCYPYYSTVH